MAAFIKGLAKKRIGAIHTALTVQVATNFLSDAYHKLPNPPNGVLGKYKKLKHRQLHDMEVALKR